MGIGMFRNGKFDLVIVANHAMSVADQNTWQRSFEKASELLFNASEGQMQFGRLFFCNDNAGINGADCILDQADGTSHAPEGGYRSIGASILLNAQVKSGSLGILHELGHYVWRLQDEYIGPPQGESIDRSQAAPDKFTIPIEVGSTPLQIDALVNGKAGLIFDNELIRRVVVSNTSTNIVVDAEYPDLPTQATGDFVIIWPSAECQTSPTANFCIMDATVGAAGSFDATGAWIPAINPITEFCVAANHDLDRDTLQQHEHGKDCWKTIQNTEGFQHLSIPDPANPSSIAGYSAPEWIILEKKPRFVLALDRSGSMEEGTKMEDTRRGAILWMDYSKAEGDDLAILWYNSSVERILSMGDASGLNTEPIVNAIQNLQPTGKTNILGALRAAHEEINPYPSRSATQVVLLMTDGLHNNPPGTSPLEVVPDFQDAGIQIYTLGAGSSDQVDLDTLTNLSTNTGALCYPTGDNQPDNIRDAMAEINLIVRGGLVTSLPIILEAKTTNSFARSSRRVKRPSLQEIMKALGARSFQDLTTQEFQKPGDVYTLPVNVEKGSRRASFTILFEKLDQLWLYVVDPKGQIVDQSYPGRSLITGHVPHEFILVEKPIPGKWLMVIVRPGVGSKIQLRALAGSENINLQIFGGAPSFVRPGTPIRFWASARWGEELSGLSVKAFISDPPGRKLNVTLNDETSAEMNSGLYEGFMTPRLNGQYKGYIQIKNTRRAIRANGSTLLHHSQDSSISLGVKAPTFSRVIPVSFLVGKKVPLKDNDRD